MITVLLQLRTADDELTRQQILIPGETLVLEVPPYMSGRMATIKVFVQGELPPDRSAEVAELESKLDDIRAIVCGAAYFDDDRNEAPEREE